MSPEVDAVAITVIRFAFAGFLVAVTIAILVGTACGAYSFWKERKQR